MSARSSTEIPSPDALTVPPDPEGSGDGDRARMRQACCPNCARASAKVFSTRDNRWLSGDAFTYYRCRACGLIFLWPIPGDLDRYYPTDYYGFPGTLQEMESAVGGERYKIEMVKQLPSGGRLLEIGPGGGGFAYLAKQAGFEVSAIEMNAESCRYLADVIGVRAIHRADSAAAVLEEGTHDVIAAWHVIEHLEDPWPTVAAAAARLAPSGILILAAPNPASFQFRILGRNWVHVDAPRHLQLIPLSVLQRRAEGLGLRPVLITTNDKGSLGWNRFGWEKSLPNILPRRPSRIFRPAARIVGGLLTSFFRPIEETGLRGSTYTVIFQKDERT
jgi:SAM-dependent methyltransferase